MIILETKKIDNGIFIFHPNIDSNHKDYNSSSLNMLYNVEETHFWFLARKQNITNVFRKYIQKDKSILEIGSGTGNVALALQKHGYSYISVGEMHLNGLQYAKNYGIKNCYQFDLFKPPFLEHFDTIGMFDVLEHLEKDKLAMECTYSMLKENGHVIITVPAHQWLWNRDDSLAGHKRRYTLKNLKGVVESAGFEVLYSRYFFISILPLLILRRILNPEKKGVENKEDQEISINPIVNFLLLKITMLENRFIHWLPNVAGGSIIIVGKKIEKK